MKRVLLVLCLLRSISFALAQGSVNFYNDPNTLVSVDSGNGQPTPIGIQSNSYYFALLTAPTGTTDPTLFSFANVYATNLAFAGRLLGGVNVVVPGWAAGTQLSYEVAGWSSSLGHDWEQGWLTGKFASAGFFGVSSIGNNYADPPGGYPSGGPPNVNLFGGATGIQTGFALHTVEANASAQGVVNFFNSPSTLISAGPVGQETPISAPAGSYYFALLIAPSGTSNAVTFTFPGIYATNQDVAGRIFGGAVVPVPGWAVGAMAAYEVAGWSSSLGHDWKQGWLSGNFGSHGYFGLSGIGTGIGGCPGGDCSTDILPAWLIFGGNSGLGGASLQSGFSLHEVSVQVFPQLRVSETTTNVMLSWPTQSLRFAIQQSRDMSAANWVTLTNAPIVTSSNSQIDIPKPTGTTFFRLVSQ
jgi:hypothetical protein